MAGRGVLLVPFECAGEGWEIVHDRLQRESARTLEEIGDRWGHSRERVRQVEMKTKQLLHRHLERLETVAMRDAA